MALSRTGKILPSLQVQDEFYNYEYFDGELISGDPTEEGVYNRTQSLVMSEQKFGELSYHVFDYTHPTYLDKFYYERLEILDDIFPSVGNIIKVHHEYVDNETELLEYEQKCLEKGYEGIMLRSPVGIYKQGRATWREGHILKLKRFQDDEGIIVGFEEGMTNMNSPESNEVGYTQRSTKKENMIPSGTLGNFLVEYKGEFISVAPGKLNHEERRHIWNNQEEFLHTYLKFRFFSYGIKDKPRFPRAIGMRDPGDFM
jgi:DNA ligase-1